MPTKNKSPNLIRSVAILQVHVFHKACLQFKARDVGGNTSQLGCITCYDVSPDNPDNKDKPPADPTKEELIPIMKTSSVDGTKASRKRNRQKGSEARVSAHPKSSEADMVNSSSEEEKEEIG